jgi:putative sporulation protein YyaC
MMIVNSDYREYATRQMLVDALTSSRAEENKMPVFICIGSERHLLDCFGPLTGTMLQESNPAIDVYGTLDQPLNARNLTKEMMIIKNRHAGQKFIAIDAAVGEENEIGRLQFKTGAIIPGRAVAKSLPAIGDFALTAIVEIRGQAQTSGQGSSQGFAHVYHMARLVQKAVEDWYCLHQQ